jgi:hypothetical protein
MSAADRAFALGQANERLQYVAFGVLLAIAAIGCARVALCWLRCSRAEKQRQAMLAEAARRARIAQTELCRQRIKFIHGREIYLPRETATSGRTTTSLRREKAAFN